MIYRCPVCKKIGSAKLGGYCKNCYPNNKTWAKERDPSVRDYYYNDKFFEEGPFFSDSYGCVKDKFDINPRY